jgi:beta-lactamase regulating signal transducer with metallopeptidase domain
VDSALLEALGWALVHFVWQGALVAGLYACADALLSSRASADARYALALSALALMLLLPLVTAAAALDSSRGLFVRGESASDASRSGDTRERVRAPGVGDASNDASSARAASAYESDASGVRLWAGERLSQFVPWLVFAWLAGVLLLAARAVGGWLVVRRLRRSAEPVAARFEELVARVSERLKVSRTVTLCRSALVEVPAVVGHLRPVILVPASAFAGLTPAQLEAVIAHELAHVRRHDYLVNLLQTAAETLLFYHPAVWWVSRRARTEREHACDDAAVRCVGDVLLYARSLAALEQARAQKIRETAALAVAADGGSLMRRIQRLVKLERNSTDARASAPLAAVAALALLACVAAATSHAFARAGVAADGGSAAARAGRRQVAVTFVNFPGYTQDARLLSNKTRKLMRALDASGARAVAFVNEAQQYRDGVPNEARVGVLREWLAAGHELGNETAHHVSLYEMPVEEFKEEVTSGDRLLSKLAAERGQKVRYFSYPYLNTGPNAETKAEVERFLGERGYRVHPVTVDNMDWLFNRAYAELLTNDDEAGAARLRADYVAYMERMFEFYENYSREVVGREIPQVLMLTAGALNADSFEDLAAMLKRRGYKFVTLEDATRDEAYSLPDTYTGARGDSWIARWAVTKGLKYRDTEEVYLPDSMKQYMAEHQKEWNSKSRGKK